MYGFKIPIRLNRHFLEENITGSIRDSIDRFIDLLVSSPHGSFKADPSFGFEFLNYRFENSDENEQINLRKIHGNSTNKNTYAYQLKVNIETYEPRLKQVLVDMKYQVKNQQVVIHISGTYEQNYVETKYENTISFYIWK